MFVFTPATKMDREQRVVFRQDLRGMLLDPLPVAVLRPGDRLEMITLPELSPEQIAELKIMVQDPADMPEIVEK